MADQAEGEVQPPLGKRAKLQEGKPKKGKQDKTDAAEKTKEHHEEAYSAAAVIFFTRGPDGAVSKVLLATEMRKVQASYIGLEQKGRVIQRMLLFPMGRREKKDKSDAVETAKREYVEETGDYGGLSKYLDFADFAGTEDGERQPTEASEGSATAEDPKIWTGQQNLAMWYAPATMIMLFCEVPPEAANNTDRAAVGGVQLDTSDDKAADAAAAEPAPSSAQEGGKKKKKEKQKAAAANKKPSPTYHVGKTDHVEAAWVEASALRDALAAQERAPRLTIAGVECRLFPVATGALRSPEARKWLGYGRAPPASDTSAPSAS